MIYEKFEDTKGGNQNLLI